LQWIVAAILEVLPKGRRIAATCIKWRQEADSHTITRGPKSTGCKLARGRAPEESKAVSVDLRAINLDPVTINLDLIMRPSAGFSPYYYGSRVV
jgi:hypothetical protein